MGHSSVHRDTRKQTMHKKTPEEVECDLIEYIFTFLRLRRGSFFLLCGNTCNVVVENIPKTVIWSE